MQSNCKNRPTDESPEFHPCPEYDAFRDELCSVQSLYTKAGVFILSI